MRSLQQTRLSSETWSTIVDAGVCYAVWLLHVVIIEGQQGWQTGLVLWVIVAIVGGGYARLTGEWSCMDALLVDLTLAAAGAAAGNAATGTFGSDPLALIFNVRVFWATLGALLLVTLAHDALHSYWQRSGHGGSPGPLGLVTHGGFRFVLLWLTGWPTEPGTVEATYDGGLAIKLLPETIHYQARVGPFAVARGMPIVDGMHAELSNSTLTLSSRPGTRAAGVLEKPLQLCRVVPAESAAAIGDAIVRRSRDPAA